MAQTAASLDALIAKPRTTTLEHEDGHALSECRVQLFGPIVPVPPPAADYTVPPSLWTFGGKGSAGGNHRLEIAPNKATILVAFTTDAAGLGANINLQWSAGTTSLHTMSIMGKSQQSQTPQFVFSTGSASGSRIVLQPFTTYVLRIDTPLTGLGGTYHLNFQNAPY